MKRIVLALAILFAPLAAVAQQIPGATPTQQVPSRLDACTGYQTASGTAQQTITISPPSTQSVYVCAIEVISTATTAPALTALTHTTTNLGAPTSFKMFDVFPAATGVVKTIFYPGNAPVKSSQPGVAVTVVSNAAVTSITYNVNVWYFFAP